MPLLGRNQGSYFSSERPAPRKELKCGELSELTVTGKLVGGTVYGSNPYTSDSDWAVAAVHAGLCAPGETIVIQRHTPKNYAPYVGSFKNSVQSTNWDTEWCGYYIKLAGTANPCGPYTEKTVTGKTSGGEVLGSNPYAEGTDDAIAAVHAGLCAAGETIIIERYDPGLLAPYTGSTKNGITSKTILATNRCGYFIKKKNDDKKKTVFDYKTNNIQTYKVPPNVTLLKAKIWGAGGGGGKITGSGGGGGYIYAEIPVTPGEDLHVYVGKGGSASGFDTKTDAAVPFPAGFGDDGAGTGGSPGWPYERVTGGMNVQMAISATSNPWQGYNAGAGGGGPSGIIRPSVPEWLAMAGGGAGAGDLGNGGPGGGADGGQGQNIAEGGGGHPGTVASGPGAAGAGLYASVGIPGEPTPGSDGTPAYIPSGHLRGGGGGYPYVSLGGGGMGGGGYWGGGAGGPLTGGGGGAGFIKAGLVHTVEKGTDANFPGMIPPSLPGNFGDSERQNKGNGGVTINKARYDRFSGRNGSDGRVIIWYD